MQRTFRFLRRPIAAAIAIVMCSAVTAPSQAPGQRGPGPSGPGGAGLWISDSPLDDGRRLLIVVDPASRHAAVYHVDSASGAMTLKSARDITWDLSLDEFNAQEPRPAAIRKMLQLPPPQAP